MHGEHFGGGGLRQRRVPPGFWGGGAGDKALSPCSAMRVPKTIAHRGNMFHSSRYPRRILKFHSSWVTKCFLVLTPHGCAFFVDCPDLLFDLQFLQMHWSWEVSLRCLGMLHQLRVSRFE